MQVEQLKQVAGRSPFHPFTIRLSNGATYQFRDPRDFGAPRSLHTIFYFGEDKCVLIDPIHIVEIVENASTSN